MQKMRHTEKVLNLICETEKCSEKAIYKNQAGAKIKYFCQGCGFSQRKKQK